MTLDGHIQRSNHSVDFLLANKDEEKLMAEFFRTIDVIIMGRKTAEISLKMNGDKLPSQGLETYVFSRSWKAGQREGFEVIKA